MMSRKRTVKILLFKNQRQVADQCFVAASFLDRLKGLIGKKAMESGQGLLLNPCNDIHMWFMSIPIDVVFIRKLNRDNSSDTYVVTSVRKNLRPWKILPVRDGRASQTIELPIGTIERCEILPGDELCIN